MADKISREEEITNPEEIRSRMMNVLECLEKMKDELVARIQSLERFAFSVASLYSAFEGVFMTSTASSSRFTCSDVWYVCLVSVLTGLPVVLCALFGIGVKYKKLVEYYDDVGQKQHKCIQVSTGYALEPQDSWTNKILQSRRRLSETPLLGNNGILWAAVLYLLVALVIIVSPWIIICKHGKDRSPTCFPLCNHSRCIPFCYDAPL